MLVPCCMKNVHGFVCDCDESKLKKLRKEIKEQEVLRDGEPCPPCTIKGYIIEDLEKLETHELGKVYKFVRKLIASA